MLFHCSMFNWALHKKSWAVIDRPYSLGCATVGALYERPRCIFCAKPTKRHKSAPNFVFSCASLWLFLFQNVMAFNESGYQITVLEVALARVANAILPGFCAGKVVSS